MTLNKMHFQKKVQEYKDLIVLMEHVKEVMKKFEHYKKVDKRFFDAIYESGKFICFLSEHPCRKLVIKGVCIDYDYGYTPSFSVYCYDKPLTWELIKKEMESINVSHWVKEFEEKVQLFEKEQKEIEELLIYVRSKNFKCFSLYDVERTLEKDLEESKD